MERDVCQDYEDGKSFYEVFGVEPTASASEIKRAYYKLALKYHPDRANTDNEDEKEKANRNFQTLGKIYETLSDPKRRSLYDATGEACDDDLFKDKDWDEHWRAMFPPVTLNDIANYEKKYKGSQMESDDVIRAYRDGNGSMTFIMENVILSSWDEEGRFKEIIEAAIKKGDVERMAEQENDSEEEEDEEEEEKENKRRPGSNQRRRKASASKGKAANAKATRSDRKRKAEKDEEQEAEQLAKALGIKTNGKEDDLKALITSNQNKAQARFSSLIAGLEAKYASPPKKKGRTGGKGRQQKQVAPEPSEEEFLAARKRLESKRKGK